MLQGALDNLGEAVCEAEAARKASASWATPVSASSGSCRHR